LGNWFQRFQAKPQPKPQSEIARILGVPVAPPFTPEREAELSLRFVQAPAYREGFRLLPLQARGLAAFLDTGRLVGVIPVGKGKTFLSMLIASIGHEQNPSSRSLLLIPPSIYEQFWLRDLPEARRKLAIAVPWLGLGNATLQKRRALAATKRPGCYVLPYSCLSTKDTQELLDTIDPDLVIADEAQALRGDPEDSAKNKRFWSWVERRKTPARGAVMSGTLTTTTPMDYYRILRWVLGPACPLPRTVVEATAWAACLRSDAEDPLPADKVEQLTPLLEWAGRTTGKPLWSNVDGVRAAYQTRLLTIPGVVASDGEQIGTSIEVRNTPAEQTSGWDQLQKHLFELGNDGRSPNGEVLKFGIEIHNAYRELSAGFYYRRFWDEAHPLAAEAKACWKAEQAYAVKLNEWFRSCRVPRKGLDTPMLVGNYHEKHGAMPDQEELYDLWCEWKELQREDLPERQSEPVWICDYKIRHAVEWAKAHKPGGIIWVWHRAVANRVQAALRDAGLPVLDKGGGASWLHNDGSEQFFCVASIESHHKGKNLQHHTQQLLLQWPRPADYCEQLMGRTHRTGQKADRLIYDTCATTDFDHEQIAATLRDTRYAAQTLGGGEHKLLLADWSPLPRDYPEEYLRQKGYT
jgi:hypothetical protein